MMFRAPALYILRSPRHPVVAVFYVSVESIRFLVAGSRIGLQLNAANSKGPRPTRETEQKQTTFAYFCSFCP